MNSTWADKGWSISSEERPAAIEIVLVKRSVILPWTQFLYADGSDEEIRLVFATHDVTIRGAGLIPLLTDLAAQRVTKLQEAIRPDRFSGSAVRLVREIIIRPN